MVDSIVEIDTRDCTACTHYLEGCKCRAFDRIPVDIFAKPTLHSKPVAHQKGDFVFTSTVPLSEMRIYDEE